MALTASNYTQGMLVDEELMAGVTEHPENPGQYVAFVLSHTTGEYLGYQAYPFLDPALEAINRIPRKWIYEKTGGCGEANCAIGGCGKGVCKGEKCQLFRPGTEASAP